MNRYREKIKIDEEQLYGRLHIDGDSPADRLARKLLPELKQMAEENMNLQMCYLTGKKAFETGIARADACEEQIICLVYGQGNPEKILEEMYRQEKYLEAWLFDALLNLYVFQGAEQLTAKIESLYEQKGFFLTECLTPGDGEIPLKRQKNLLFLMKKEENLPVEINDGYMLKPEKSLLFAFGAKKNMERQKNIHHCQQCHRKDCLFRMKNEAKEQSRKTAEEKNAI